MNRRPARWAELRNLVLRPGQLIEARVDFSLPLG